MIGGIPNGPLYFYQKDIIGKWSVEETVRGVLVNVQSWNPNPALVNDPWLDCKVAGMNKFCLGERVLKRQCWRDCVFVNVQSWNPNPASVNDPWLDCKVTGLNKFCLGEWTK